MKILQLCPPQCSKNLSIDENQGATTETERMRTHPSQRNPNKFYLYHHDHGHDTEECIQLQDKIEELIR